MHNFTYIDDNGTVKVTNRTINKNLNEQTNFSAQELELPDSKIIHKATKYSTDKFDKIVVYLHDHLNKDKASFIEIISYRITDRTVSYIHLFGKYLELREEAINVIKLVDKSPGTLDIFIRSLLSNNKVRPRQ